jgi:hypothetical protein
MSDSGGDSTTTAEETVLEEQSGDQRRCQHVLFYLSDISFVHGHDVLELNFSFRAFASPYETKNI